MASYTRFDLPSGGSLFVEMDEEGPHETGPNEQPMGLGSSVTGVQKAQESLIDSLHSFVPSVDAMLSQLRVLSPDQLTVEMNIAFSSEVGIAIAKAGGQGHLRLIMSWNAEGSGE